MEKLKPGDTIHARGIAATIAKIACQDIWNGNDNKECYDIEFFDTNGFYRSWKSWIDGGTVTRK